MQESAWELGQRAARQQRLRADVQAGYAELLNRVPWSYFVTLTCDPKRFPRMGEESWRSAWSWFHYTWIRECARRAGQVQRVEDWRQSGPGGEAPRVTWRGPWANAWRHGRGQPQWALALEPHRDDRLHAHALVRLTRHVPWLDYSVGQRIWSENRGTWCRFEVPRDRGDVCAYVTKYVVKCGSDAITFSDNFEAPMMARRDTFAPGRMAVCVSQ